MKKLSVRMRLTLSVAVLLSLLCLTFTMLAQYHMRRSLIEPMYGILPSEQTVPAVSAEDSPEIALARTSVPAMKVTLVQGEQSFASGLWLIMLGTIAVGTLLTYAVASVALKPIKDLSRAIDAVDEKALVCNLTGFQAGDEVNRLAVSFESLLSRLRTAFERERRFSAYAAHELKTPLSVIKTALDIMDDDDYADAEICRETLQTIGKQNDRMINLSAQLLILSRLQAKGDMQPVNLRTLVSEIAEELRPLAAGREIKLHCELTDKEVTADPVMLKHAVSNLVENAIRYNVDGGSVEIALHADALIVSDTGIGIPAEDAEHIFEPFYRVDKSRSRSAGGTGLGLAIAHEILVQCGAAVRYEPNEPTGSRFIVAFPGGL